jgi:phytoene dehydrogenase-like protein
MEYYGRVKSYDVAVIGAGHNGLACAALLAKAGHSVAVFENNPVLGGATLSERDVWPGYTVSTASYVCSLLDPWLIEELDLAAHGYSAYRKDPTTFTPLADGRSLLLGRDAAANAREVAAFSERDVDGLLGYDAEISRLGSELFETFSDAQPRFDRFDPGTQAALRGSAASLVERFFETPALQATIATDGLIGTYLGPRDSGTGYVLAHHAAGRALGIQGAWGFVRGGMGAVARALAGAARAHGAVIFEGAPVTHISLDLEGRANGIVLGDGREIAATAIASNAHPHTTFAKLVGEAVLEERVAGGATLVEKLSAWKTVGPSVKLNLALGELPNFVARPGSGPQAHHSATIHITPSLDFLQDACESARAVGESAVPMLECFLQTPTEPDLAPAGKHILSIFAQYFPYDREGGWTPGRREAIADKIVGLLAEYAPNIPGAIEGRQLLAPPDLEARFGLVGGHIFHGELLPGQIFEERFATRTPVRGLYLCGSGAHPGGCVSGFPGKRAAEAIALDLVTHAS